MSGTPLREVFVSFLWLGATAYGGPAMMAPLQAECVGRQQWLTEQQFKEGMALCQVIPGPTMVQMAAYVGYRLRRLPGALAAAAGFVLPAFVLMAALSTAYFQFGALPRVRAVFHGLAAIVVAIILDAALRLVRTAIESWQGAILAALAFTALTLRVNLVLVLAASALLALGLFRKRRMSSGPKGAAGQ